MLKGIRVIDFSQYLPGPHATLRLAEMGAEVIKVESPSGDPARSPIGPNEKGYLFKAQNRNKKSVILNLKDGEDVEAALQLIKKADVVIEGFRPGVAERLGIDYQTVTRVKENIIYCSLTGYGQTGPLRDMGGHDINYMALSGVLAQMKDKENRPILPSTTFADFIGSITASEAILAALVKRERTGEGSYLDISLTDSMLAVMSNHIPIEHATGDPNGVAALRNKVICYSIYETKDGRYVSLGALEPKFWQNFCRAISKEHLYKEQFTPVVSANPVYEQIKAIFKGKTLAEWTRFGFETDCCLAPILETGELAAHPYHREKGRFLEMDGVRYIAATSLAEENRHGGTAPEFGEHSELVRELMDGKV